MNFIDNIASVFGSSKRISGIQTMIFTGNGNISGFEIDLTSFYGLKDAYEKGSPISAIIGKLAMFNFRYLCSKVFFLFFFERILL